MSGKRILITGISGFVGWHINLMDKTGYEIIGTYGNQEVSYEGVNCLQIDLEKKENILAFLNRENPDAVIHLAALSNPNYCENKEEESFLINVEATKIISDWCVENNRHLVFSSTDLVFDGQEAPYVETDKNSPISIYGKHKLEAENHLLNSNKKAAIARLPLMFGLPKNEKGYLSNWVSKLQNKESISAFVDEYRTQLWALDALKGLFLLSDKKAAGVYHLGGPERTSRFGFIQQVAKRLGHDESLINASYQADVNMAAKRPADVSLVSKKIQDLGFEPASLDTFFSTLKM